ncbi:unnamed protein product [Thlaspi arvense]|uniref:UBX domain-containing protein n=1 Tax=Thlaspi arvense TaxID=13288 RepID=A0AAU9T9W9_THLAR|nr:unnamed protein product [Thlaspi arvense]
METATSDSQQKLISSFMEIAVGQTMETAIGFLKATTWNLEEAINLFLIHNQPPNNQNSSQQYRSGYQEEQIPLPLPSVRATLCESSSMNQAPLEVHSEKIWESESESESSDSSSDGSSDLRLSSLFRPPRKLLFKGSFEDAKKTSSRKDLWLLVNLQSTIEFASHALNRDLWSNEAVSQAIESSFILLQVYDDTTEGQKVSTFYKIESAPPVVLLIDPITGQKMRSWTGQIDSQSFVEDLTKYIDSGPHEHIASQTSNKRMKTNMFCSQRNHTTDNQNMSTDIKYSVDHTDHIVAPQELEELTEHEAETCPSSNHSDHILAPLNEEFEESAEVKEEDTCLGFPALTEEPKGDCDRSIVCSLCVRFPDGRRKQRKFLKSEPIQLLWSFCYSQMDESEKKEFKLVQAIPGASKTLDYGASNTFDQSGLANSIVSVTWE